MRRLFRSSIRWRTISQKTSLSSIISRTRPLLNKLLRRNSMLPSLKDSVLWTIWRRLFFISRLMLCCTLTLLLSTSTSQLCKIVVNYIVKGHWIAIICYTVRGLSRIQNIRSTRKGRMLKPITTCPPPITQTCSSRRSSLYKILFRTVSSSTRCSAHSLRGCRELIYRTRFTKISSFWVRNDIKLNKLKLFIRKQTA